MTASATSRRAATPGTLEEPQVRAMFDRIAGLYDRMNTVMTAGLHHQWRRRAADLARAGARVTARSTSPPAPAIWRSSSPRGSAPGGEVVGVDFSERMLELARAQGAARRAARWSRRVRFEPANALALPFADGEFDAATVGFGARNFSDLERGLREMARVVRPGGRVVVLEITTPRRPPLSTFFELWFDRVVPGARPAGRRLRRPTATCRARSGGSRARGARGCDVGAAGCDRIRYVLTAGGIIALHVGEVPTR